MCRDEGFRRLLEIELALCGIPLSSEPEEALLWLMDLDDGEATIPDRPEGSRLLCWSRHPSERFPFVNTEVGDACFLQRPFALTALEERVKGLVYAENESAPRPIPTPRGAARGRAAEKDPVGDLVLRPLSRGVVSVGGRQIALTPREWALFECLWQKRGTLVPKETLWAALCAVRSDGSPTANTLEVYICHLRKKLEKPVARRLIVTVRGQGYRLEAD